MNWPAAEGALNASNSAVVGRYTYRPKTDEWTWSDAMYRIHGFEPGQVVPTTELVLRHMHPADRDAAWESREAVVERHEPSSFLHRIVTAAGDERVVIAVGHLEHEADETPVVCGHFLDLTRVRQDAVEAEVDSAVKEFAEHRASSSRPGVCWCSCTAWMPRRRSCCCGRSPWTPT